MSTLAIVALAAVVIAACIALAYRLLTLFAGRLIALHEVERSDWNTERGELKVEIAELRKQLRNAQDKIETLFGEWGDLQNELGAAKGVITAEEVKAEVKKRVDRIESTPQPEDEPEPKRGGRHGKG